MKALNIAAITITLMTTAIADAKYEAHEWGTFTSLVGSNGITQNGMYHEDEPLPSFVYKFGEVQADRHRPVVLPPPEEDCRHSKICFSSQMLEKNIITQKMETPVIYFYSDKTDQIEVNVKFPEGVVTESYPGPMRTFPKRGDNTTIADGDTTYDVIVKPPGKNVSHLPLVSSNNIYSHARNVASDFVMSAVPYGSPEVEKFIFYRGLGRFQPQMDITSNEGRLSIRSKNPLPAMFLVHVNEAGHGQMLPLFGRNSVQVGDLELQRLMNHSQNQPGILTGVIAKNTIVNALIKEGLFADEALAMVNTWEHGYLKVPGLRLLYMLPRNEVDAILPLKMTPAPEKLTRVFVARIEVLLDTFESKIVSDVLARGDNFNVNSLGRFAEPMLRRAAEVYRSTSLSPAPNKIQLFDRLISRAAKSIAEGVNSTAH